MIEQDSTLLGFFNPYIIKCSGCNHNSDTNEQNLNYVFSGVVMFWPVCSSSNSVSSSHYIAGDGRTMTII